MQVDQPGGDDTPAGVEHSGRPRRLYAFAHGGPLWGNGVRKQVLDFGRFTHQPDGTPPKGTPAQRRSGARPS